MRIIAYLKLRHRGFCHKAAVCLIDHQIDPPDVSAEGVVWYCHTHRRMMVVAFNGKAE